MAALTRHRDPDDPPLSDARRDLAAERLTEVVRRVIAAAPPLTPEQRDRIAALLRGALQPTPDEPVVPSPRKRRRKTAEVAVTT